MREEGTAIYTRMPDELYVDEWNFKPTHLNHGKEYKVYDYSYEKDTPFAQIGEFKATYIASTFCWYEDYPMYTLSFVDSHNSDPVRVVEGVGYWGTNILKARFPTPTAITSPK